MLGNRRGNQTREYRSNYVVFDLETTGTSPKKDGIVEISALRVRDGEVVEEFTSLVNPMMHIPYYASQVNGITDDMVEDEPTIDDILPEFINFIGEDVLVGHNIHCFDMKYIWRDCEKVFGKVPNNNYIDRKIVV